MAPLWRSALVVAGVIAFSAALPSAAPAQQRMKGDPALIYVPTPQVVVDKMLEVAKVTKDDYVFDLGSGDGRIPITAAARYGARGLGVETNPSLVKLARTNAEAAGVANLVEFRQQDLFKTSVREATVVGLYLFVWANVRLRPRLISELRPGSRIVAHDFPIGDDWKPDIEEEIENRTVYLWYVPAQVAGIWTVSGGPPGLTLQLQQRFQAIEGTATVDGRTVPLHNASLRGDAIEFTIVLEAEKPMLFRGLVKGGTMEPRGEETGAVSGWSAARQRPQPQPAARPASRKKG